MSLYTVSNWRAAFYRVAVCCTFIVLAVPVSAQVHLTDEATGIDGELYGGAICALDDLNSDGLDEFLVGAPGHVSENGTVFLWRSRDGGTAHGVAQTWHGTAGERFGWSVARIGDVNDDGDPDFAVGAPLANDGATDNGRVYIFYGGSSISSSPDVIIAGQNAGDQFGFSISAAGDFDGDGHDDFIVGAPYRNSPSLEGGAAYVIFGSGSGPSDDPGDALYLAGEVAEDHFGWSVTDVGTFFDGNEFCVAVGAPEHDSLGFDAGAVYVFEGARLPSSPDATHDLKVSVAEANSRTGAAVRGIGDFNGDNTPDLAMGAPGYSGDRGRIEIIFGDANPSTSADRYVNGETGGDHFGWSLGRIWNVIGSGNDDLLIGAPHHASVATDGGRAYLYAGGSGSYSSASSLTLVEVAPLIPGTEANDEFGLAVCGAGDFDGDGDFDWAVGAPWGNAANSATSGFVYLGLSTGTAVPNLLSAWSAAWRDDAAVQLVFSLGVTATRIEIVRDGETVWDGPAVDADLAEPGRLVAVGRSYSFIDRPDPRTRPDYSLRVTTADGAEAALVDLAGPGTYTGVLPSAELALDGAWPNPFNPVTRIRFRAPAGEAAEMAVTDLRGRHVRTLFTGTGDGLWQTVIWDGRGDDGRSAASGVYLLRLSGGGEVRGGRVVLAK